MEEKPEIHLGALASISMLVHGFSRFENSIQSLSQSVATITTQIASVEQVVGGLAARVAALEGGAVSASGVSGSAGSWPLLEGSTATGSQVLLTKTEKQDADSTKTQVQMMKMHEAPFSYGFLVSNAFLARTRGLKRHSLQPTSQKGSTAKEELNSDRIVFETRAKCQDFVARSKILTYSVNSLFETPRVQFLFNNPVHLICERSVESLRRSGKFWLQNYKKIVHEYDTVPTIDFRSQVLHVFDRRYGIGVPVFLLAPVGHEQMFGVISP